MKRISHNYTLFLLFIFLVISTSFLASARVLQPKSQQGSVQESKDDTSTADNEDNISNLMGMEKSEGCGNTEEECNSDRKLEEEAHLDYIYTQKHRRP